MYMTYCVGPKTDPCGTPHNRVVGIQSWLWTDCLSASTQVWLATVWLEHKSPNYPTWRLTGSHGLPYQITVMSISMSNRNI